MNPSELSLGWKASVNEVAIGATAAEGGTRGKTVKIGGSQCIPWLSFEGAIGHRPAIAVEIWDCGGSTWPEILQEAYGSAISDPVAWAKAAAALNPDLLCLRLMGTHPSMNNASPAEAAEKVRAILDAVDLPLVIWGCDVDEKDNVVLPKCSEAAKGENCLMGSAKEKNYRTLVASCLADGHKLIAESPLDINIAKQVNILAHDVGYPLENIVIYPTTAALGYGSEYVFSIMERGRLAGLSGDKLLQQPALCDVGSQAWRAKEAVGSAEALPGLGSPKDRGPMWETLTATNYLQAGADLIILRHPEAVRKVQENIERLYQTAAAV